MLSTSSGSADSQSLNVVYQARMRVLMCCLPVDSFWTWLDVKFFIKYTQNPENNLCPTFCGIRFCNCFRVIGSKETQVTIFKRILHRMSVSTFKTDFRSFPCKKFQFCFVCFVCYSFQGSICTGEVWELMSFGSILSKSLKRNTKQFTAIRAQESP